MDIKTIALTGIAALATHAAHAQEDNFQYKFNGLVLNSINVSTHESRTGQEGTLYLYPLDNRFDPNGRNINHRTQLNMYNLRTQLGVSVSGPQWGGARTSALVEVDFVGSSSNAGVLRLRHAYFLMDWGRTSLLVGQTWHPLQGDFRPNVLNGDTGAPFNPMGRAPQVRLRHTIRQLTLSLHAIWQTQSKSMDGEGISGNALRQSALPELFAGADYRWGNLTAGVGVEYLPLRMRQTSDEGYKVSERLNSLSAEAHLHWKRNNTQITARTLLLENITFLNTTGGFGVSGTDSATGERTYAPLRTLQSWVNVAHGSRWQFSLFGGYIKNLGAAERVQTLMGYGTDIDRMAGLITSVSYNKSHLKIGIEHNVVTAWYGSPNSKGRVTDAHAVTGHHFTLVTQYTF